MAHQRGIAYYVTSHRYGHLNRSASVIEAIPTDVPVVVKTHPDLFMGWRQSVRRSCELLEGVFDCGAVHPKGESSLVDPAATLAAYDRVHAATRACLDEEVAFLRAGRFAAAVSDIAPLPLRAAREAGIPAILVANFTWSDILYVGRYGQEDMEWENLSRLADFEFVSYHRLNLKISNWHVVDPVEWPPRDLAASVDSMVAKAGYGTVTDAMTHRTPLVFPPRFGFVEHRVLAAGLARWGGGIPIGTREFKEFRLHRALETACQIKPGFAPWPTDGARRCAREILKLADKSD